MNQQQPEQTEGLAQNFQKLGQSFSEALIASYRMSSRRDPELTRRFCSAVIKHLDAQVAEVSASHDQLEETESDQDSAVVPEQESVGAYMGFLSDMVAYYMGRDPMTAADYEGREEASEGGLSRRG
jgi:hypothetical protein